MYKSISFTIIALCALVAVLVGAQHDSSSNQTPTNGNQQQQQPQQQGQNGQSNGNVPTNGQNQMQNQFPNSNQMQNQFPNSNQMQNQFPNGNQMQNQFPNGNQMQNQANQMPWNQFQNNNPFNQQQQMQQQQMNPNQIGAALTNMLQRGMSLLQAVRQLLSSLRNSSQGGQMMPNFGQTNPMNNMQFGNQASRSNGPVSLSALTGPLDGVLAQTGLPLQVGSITNPVSSTLNGLLNPGGLLGTRR